MTLVVDAADVGVLLRTWRERRRFSQQELSNRSRVSTRHLSRVETGRAHPTPDMVLRLADHLDVPLRERNRLLLAAGYAPHYQDNRLDDGPVAVVMEGLRHLLDAHLPTRRCCWTPTGTSSTRTPPSTSSWWAATPPCSSRR